MSKLPLKSFNSSTTSALLLLPAIHQYIYFLNVYLKPLKCTLCLYLFSHEETQKSCEFLVNLARAFAINSTLCQAKCTHWWHLLENCLSCTSLLPFCLLIYLSGFCYCCFANVAIVCLFFVGCTTLNGLKLIGLSCGTHVSTLDRYRYIQFQINTNTMEV